MIAYLDLMLIQGNPMQQMQAFIAELLNELFKDDERRVLVLLSLLSLS